MIRVTAHRYLDVPRLGTVSFTKHALAELARDGVTETEREEVLLKGVDVPDSGSIIRRRLNGIRLVIQMRPVPDYGAKVVVTAYRETVPPPKVR